ncbi:MAG: amidohydrolase family protein, partial [Gemmatimonadota bacterium]|nr:amidohydrolase family protein [Gemmatimonadota bacterium]
SDARPYGPLVGIQAAVTRRARDGQVYAPEERVDVKDAIRFYTLGSAYMTFDEANRGSIEVGKLADLVVLSDDILNMDPERISEIQVLRTVIEGRTVYEAGVPASSQ